jgi:antitoxin (DNA-binding transcriptional repressor) of toxin-antitoxin stability system
MIKRADAGELARRLMEFLDEVNAGNEILVLREDKPVARLIAVAGVPRADGRSIRHLAPLDGKWTGEAILRSGDLADEMFAGE